MAIYPGRGSRFARHIDNTAGDGRRLTVLCYLNPSWSAKQGGALRLWPPDGSSPVDVLPTCGRLALFYSKTVPHGALLHLVIFEGLLHMLQSHGKVKACVLVEKCPRSLLSRSLGIDVSVRVLQVCSVQCQFGIL